MDGKKIDTAGEPSDEAAIFQVTHGPEKLPSEYLRTLQQNGWVCLTSILSPGILEDLERVRLVPTAIEIGSTIHLVLPSAKVHQWPERQPNQYRYGYSDNICR